jgi:glutaryl-CoA dehydrogenase
VDFNAFADIAIVWAKNEEGIHGLIVERGMEGFTTPKLIINGRFVHHQLEINFDNVKVPKENLYLINLD